MSKKIAGNEEYITNAVLKYSDTVLRVAYYRTGDHHLAEDITQEVFLKLLSQKEMTDEHLRAWLIRCAIHRAADAFRQRARRKEEALPENGEESPVLSYENYELLDAVNALPADERTVVYLYYYEGYSAKEIAGLLHKNQNTVASLIRRGREALKGELLDE